MRIVPSFQEYHCIFGHHLKRDLPDWFLTNAVEVFQDIHLEKLPFPELHGNFGTILQSVYRFLPWGS